MAPTPNGSTSARPHRPSQAPWWNSGPIGVLAYLCGIVATTIVLMNAIFLGVTLGAGEGRDFQLFVEIFRVGPMVLASALVVFLWPNRAGLTVVLLTGLTQGLGILMMLRPVLADPIGVNNNPAWPTWVHFAVFLVNTIWPAAFGATIAILAGRFLVRRVQQSSSRAETLA